jgi:hypothetical protein
MFLGKLKSRGDYFDQYIKFLSFHKKFGPGLTDLFSHIFVSFPFGNIYNIIYIYTKIYLLYIYICMYVCIYVFTHTYTSSFQTVRYKQARADVNSKIQAARACTHPFAQTRILYNLAQKERH